MTINDLAKRTVQPIGWRKDNSGIPENHLNDILESATNMPAALLTLPIKKPFKIWVPHREGELENALSCASVWAQNQCQDQTFNNASTVLVYMLTEPEHLDYKTKTVDLDKRGIGESNIPFNHIMDELIQQDWIKTKALIDNQIKKEQVKKDSGKYDQRPMWLNPFTGWNSEHLSGLNITLGMAMGAVSLRCRELGYFCQFYTAYRQTVDWHNEYGNKFQKDGKWFPYMLQIIGTQPEAGKMSSRLNMKYIDDTTHTVDPNTKADSDPTNDIDQGIEIFKPKVYRKFVTKELRSVPDSQIDFFQRHYGQYSDNARGLFQTAYAGRVDNAGEVYEHWYKNNN